VLEAFVAGASGAVDARLRLGEGGAGQAGETIDERLRARGELGSWNGPVQQSALLGRAAVERLGTEDEPPGEGRAAQSGQPLRAAGARDEAELDLGQADARFDGADAQ